MQPLTMSAKLSSCAALLIAATAAVHSAHAASISGAHHSNMTQHDPTTTPFKLSLAQSADSSEACINLDREGDGLSSFDKCDSRLTDYPLAVFTTIPVPGSANGAFLLHEMHYGGSKQCVEYDRSDDKDAKGPQPFELEISDCKMTDPKQHFTYNNTTGRIGLAGTNLCFAQIPEKRPPGEGNWLYLAVTDCEGLTDEQAKFVMVFDDVHIDAPEFED